MELGVGRVGVFVPGERVPQQRLAQPEVVEPRKPIGLGEEVVQRYAAKRLQDMFLVMPFSSTSVVSSFSSSHSLL